MKSSIIKRSISMDGRKTSISLEDAFWSRLKEIAQDQGATLSGLVAKIDNKRERGNLSSAIRLYVLEHVRTHGTNGSSLDRA
jgi:predicted DNA-binding ribbon-helix-helix protein